MAQKLTDNQIRYRRELARVGRAKMREIWREKARRRRRDPEALMDLANRQLVELGATSTRLNEAVTRKMAATTK